MTRCDQEMGGYSTVNFDYDELRKMGHFHGYLNLDLPKNNPEITRSGYAMFRTKDQKESWLSGNVFWDWSNFQSLVLRVRGDRHGSEINKLEVKTVGIGLLDKQYGPYSLDVDWIKVMTGAEVEKVADKSRHERLSILSSSENENNSGVESDIPIGNGGSALNTSKNQEPKDTVF
ncbi:hypothetical protein QCA50_019070 [Cerrena zonata]|uniref:NADH:ubiquinone oxidoreductase intermediate-associated protein 30 domain-containing protein n=1 Tax=Cerrena zonata TaxID=2478898 RepID=A0AAW0FK62_9APHY